MLCFLQNILKDKNQILNKWMEGVVSKDAVYLNPRQLTYGDIDHLVWQWYQKNSCGDQRITGKQIQDTALQIAKELGYDKFTASTGWLNGWQRRHNVRLGISQTNKGNSSDGVDPAAVGESATLGLLQANSTNPRQTINPLAMEDNVMLGPSQTNTTNLNKELGPINRTVMDEKYEELV